jgi:transposase
MSVAYDRYTMRGQGAAVSVLGIDVSKAAFNCCLNIPDGRFEATFANAPSGFRKLLRWLEEHHGLDVHVCMEATGPYWRGLANALNKALMKVSVVNPGRTALFARSQLRRTKTDEVDARMLADFCETQKPDLWEPPAPEILELRAFLTYRKQLIRQRVALRQVVSQVVASSSLRKINAVQLQSINDTIDAVEQQIKLVIDKNRHLHQRVERVKSIVGFGMLGAAAIVSQLPVAQLRNAKAVAAYAGLSPSDRQSGTSLHGKPRICKVGNAELRRDLYMPAIVAMRFNPILRAFAERLRARGKPAKVIIVAVMRKLAVLAYTMLTKEAGWAPTET